MNTVNAELELIVEGYVINAGFDLDLAMDAVVHTAEVLLDPLERRGPVGNLNQPRGFVDGHAGSAPLGEQDVQFRQKFLPEIYRIFERQVHGGAAGAARCAARSTATTSAAPATTTATTAPTTTPA